MTLTRRQVAAALAKGPERTEDGQFKCQVPGCDRVFDKPQSLGPHQLSHRREVGLAPPRALDGRMQRARSMSVDCAVENCGVRLRFGSYRTHLRNVHRMSTDKALVANEDARVKLIERVNGFHESTALVPVEPEPEQEPLFVDVSGAEAAAGILNAARRDGLLPIRMLPEVHEWVQHTEKLLARLESLSR